MFACIVAGRPAQEAAQVAPDRFVFQLQDAAHVNHLVVFTSSELSSTQVFAAVVAGCADDDEHSGLTTAPFPDPNYGAAVYFNPPNRPDQWSFLGVSVLYVHLQQA